MSIHPESQLIEITDGNIGAIHLASHQRLVGCDTCTFGRIGAGQVNPGASAFYEKLGFKRTEEYKASHFITFCS